MSKTRKQHAPKFKAKVALEAAKGLKTTGQIATEFGVATGQISSWKKQLIGNIADIFERPNKPKSMGSEEQPFQGDQLIIANNV